MRLKLMGRSCRSQLKNGLRPQNKRSGTVRTDASCHTRFQPIDNLAENVGRSERISVTSTVFNLSPVCGPERKDIPSGLAWETLKRFNSFKKTGTDALFYQARE
jgi:hypothetical protein